MADDDLAKKMMLDRAGGSKDIDMGSLHELVIQHGAMVNELKVLMERAITSVQGQLAAYKSLNALTSAKVDLSRTKLDLLSARVSQLEASGVLLGERGPGTGA